VVLAPAYLGPAGRSRRLWPDRVRCAAARPQRQIGGALGPVRLLPGQLARLGSLAGRLRALVADLLAAPAPLHALGAPLGADAGHALADAVRGDLLLGLHRGGSGDAHPRPGGQWLRLPALP